MLRILINSCETHCVSQHRRSRLCPILLSQPSPFSRLRRLTPPFSVSAILSSSSSHARLWPSQLKPKRVSVLRKSKKKEEPVLEDLPIEYYDDSKAMKDWINPQLITMCSGANGFGQGTMEHYLSDSINALRNYYGDKKLFTPF